MKKILIIGIVASGKTTLARTLSQHINIPWHELDAIVHHQTESGRIKRTPEEQMNVIHDINKQGTWILEGTDRASYQPLYDMADTIIFLDPPLWKRKIRIFLRFAKQRFGIEKANYTPDLSMLRMMYRWTKEFEQNRDSFESKLKRYENKLVRLRDNTDLAWVAQRRQCPGAVGAERQETAAGD